MNGNPSAKQKRFHEWAIMQDCITGCGKGRMTIHHIKGSRMQLRGVDGFAGEWYILPLSYFWHLDLSNKDSVDSNRKAFEKYWGKTQNEFWVETMENYLEQKGEYPMPEYEFHIIKARGSL